MELSRLQQQMQFFDRICSKGKMWHEHSVTVEKVLKRNKVVLDREPEIILEYVRRKITEAVEKHYFYNEKEDRALESNCCQRNDITIRNAGADHVKPFSCNEPGTDTG